MARRPAARDLRSRADPDPARRAHRAPRGQERRGGAPRGRGGGRRAGDRAGSSPPPARGWSRSSGRCSRSGARPMPAAPKAWPRRSRGARNELASIAAELTRLRNGHALLGEQLDAVRGLAEKGLYPRLRLVTVESQLSDLGGRQPQGPGAARGRQGGACRGQEPARGARARVALDPARRAQRRQRRARPAGRGAQAPGRDPPQSRGPRARSTASSRSSR